MRLSFTINMNDISDITFACSQENNNSIFECVLLRKNQAFATNRARAVVKNLIPVDVHGRVPVHRDAIETITASTKGIVTITVDNKRIVYSTNKFVLAKQIPPENPNRLIFHFQGTFHPLRIPASKEKLYKKVFDAIDSMFITLKIRKKSYDTEVIQGIVPETDYDTDHIYKSINTTYAFEALSHLVDHDDEDIIVIRTANTKNASVVLTSRDARIMHFISCVGGPPIASYKGGAI